MKTKQYIVAMLVALIFATASIQAQTAQRTRSKENQVRPKSTNTQVRKAPAQKARATQSARKAQSQRAPQNQAKAPERKVQATQSQQHRTGAPSRNAQTRQVTTPARKAQTRQVTTPAREVEQRQAAVPGRNLSTPERRQGNVNSAPRKASDNRTASRNSYAKPRFSAPRHTAKYHNRQYYGGHYYHYAYPTSKVKLHVHHDTYLHHYNVLYYPSHTNIYWNRNMYHNYRKWYPDYHWNYNYGYRIQTISVFDAKYNLGEVAMVYGRVYATWHNKETDDYLLFFGGNYPYQQFTVVLPGPVARRFSWRPERYFLGEHLTTTGLITTFDGIPEIVVKNKRQIGIY